MEGHADPQPVVCVGEQPSDSQSAELPTIKTNDSSVWDPASVQVVQQIELDACFVRSPASGSVRADSANIVVLDGLIDEGLRSELLGLLTTDETAPEPPTDRWERRTVDDGNEPHPTWGLQAEHLAQLPKSEAIVEVNTRLSRLYRDADICHFGIDQCDAFVANAAVFGDDFLYHVDADPMELPKHSAFQDKHGVYVNRDAGKPRLVSMIAYLNSSWALHEAAETMFLDAASDTGVFMRPKPGRVVLMDQDIMHKLTTPARAAARPRYSLVWKLAFVGKDERAPSLFVDDPRHATAFGSAQRMRAMLNRVQSK